MYSSVQVERQELAAACAVLSPVSNAPMLPGGKLYSHGLGWGLNFSVMVTVAVGVTKGLRTE